MAFYTRSQQDFRRTDGLMVVDGSWHKPRNMTADYARQDYCEVLIETQRALSAKLSIVREELRNASERGPLDDDEEEVTTATVPGTSSDAVPPECLRATFARNPL